MYVAAIDESCYIADDAAVIGNITIKENCSVWNHATVRSMNQKILIGRGTNIQDNAVVHVDKDFAVQIGENVTVGHSAIVHGCKVGDNTIIGMGSIILNGAVIGKNCIIGAGALVTQNTVISNNSLVIGSPAKVVRKVTEDEIKEIHINAVMYQEEAKELKSYENK